MATEIDCFKHIHEIPKESKRAMTTAALFTRIFQQYLDANCCPYMDEAEHKTFSAELLDHVLIVGGFCRDILVNRAVNDIDIMVNLRELNKLQRKHLIEYHSKTSQQDKNCRCVHWQRYLNKLTVDAAFTKEQEELPELERMHNMNHILNANFWLDILRADERLASTMSVADFPSEGYHSVQIVNSVKYGGIDCDTQRIDIVDTFRVDQALQTFSLQKDAKRFHRKSRQLSMTGLDILCADLGQNKAREEKPATNARPIGGKTKTHRRRLTSKQMYNLDFDMGTECDDEQYIAIEVPVYSGKVRYKLLNYDLSINTCILPLSNILKLKEFNTAHANHRTPNMTWSECVENGLGECDGIKDCINNKVLRPPGHIAQCSILAHPQSYVFWRVVGWKIVCPDFEVRVDLLKALQDDFKTWLTPEWFAQLENRNQFMALLLHTLERDCKTIGDVKQMLSVMADLGFTSLFVAVAQQSAEVRRQMTQCIHECNNGNLARNEICEAFNEHALALLSDDEYDELEWSEQLQLEEVLESTENQLQRQKTRNLELRGDNDRTSETAAQLEEALDEAKRQTVDVTKSLEKTKERLTRAKTRNLELKKQLNEFKEKLAAVELARKTAEDSNEICQEQLCVLKADSRAKDSSIEKLSLQNEQLKRKADGLANDSQRMQQQLQQQEKQFQEMRQGASQMQQTMQQQEMQFQKMRQGDFQRMDSYAKTVAMLKEKNSKLAAQVQKAQLSSEVTELALCTELQKVKDENKLLVQSKKDLTMRTAKQIDEMRNYLKQYQEAAEKGSYRRVCSRIGHSASQSM